MVLGSLQSIVLRHAIKKHAVFVLQLLAGSRLIVAVAVVAPRRLTVNVAPVIPQRDPVARIVAFAKAEGGRVANR